MAREPVFYSFHFDSDVFRVQQIRNMGAIDGDEPVSPNDWETVKRRGDAAIESWIDENMKYKRCVVVLIGSQTAARPWVQYEVKRAWELKKGLLGVHIHNLKCPRSGICAKGANPFDRWNVGTTPMSTYVTCHDPTSWDAYGDVSRNLQSWVSSAIEQAKYR